MLECYQQVGRTFPRTIWFPDAAPSNPDLRLVVGLTEVVGRVPGVEGCEGHTYRSPTHCESPVLLPLSLHYPVPVLQRPMTPPCSPYPRPMKEVSVAGPVFTHCAVTASQKDRSAFPRFRVASAAVISPRLNEETEGYSCQIAFLLFISA